MAKHVTLLTCVAVVVRENPSIFDCQGICERIESFIDGPDRWLKMLSQRFPFSEIRDEEALDKAMQVVAARGFLHISKWLNWYFPTRDGYQVAVSTAIMDTAAANGHLDVVAFLHNHRREGCSVKAMDEAAANGHLEVVKYLHKFREEGCTVKAMDEAAIKGHTNIVKWLHSNRKEGCSSDALYGAVHRDDMKLFKYLKKRYRHIKDVPVLGESHTYKSTLTKRIGWTMM